MTAFVLAALLAGAIIPDPDLAGAERQVADKIAACRRFVASHPGSAHAWGTLAMSLDVHGYEPEALAAYRQAAALAPGDFRWSYYPAIVLAEQGSPAAVELFALARRLQPGYAPLLVRHGDALLAAGEVEAAREAFAAAVAADPGLSHAHLGLARIALLEGDLETGIGQARRAVEAAPRHGEAHGLLAELYRRAGDGEAAARERAVERRLPDLTPLPDPAAATLAAEGVSSYWFCRRGRAYVEAGSYGDAVRELERALAAAPRAEIHDDLGLALQGLGRYDEAVEHHRAALELRPDHAASLVQLGTALDGAGRLEAAIEATARALALRPDLLPAALNLGTYLARAGRRAEAAAAFRRGLEHAPDDLRLASRLAWLLATAPEDAVRDGAEAVRLAEAVCERLGGRVPEALDVLAAAYAEAGRFDEAVVTARRARELAHSDVKYSELARAIEERVDLYASGEAFREKSSLQPR